MRSQSPINIAMTLLLSLQLVLLRSKKGFPRLIGYPNFINDLTKLVSSQTLAHVQVREKQRTGTGTIKRQIPLLIPKREINKYYK